MSKSICCGAETRKDYLNNVRCSNCLLITTPKKTFRLFYIILSSLIFLGFTTQGKKSIIPKYIIYNKVDTTNKEIDLNDSCIYQELIKDSCIFPEIALKQAHLEGNWYKSDLIKTNKNLFGLKCNCKYTNGFKNGHTNYSSYKNCIACYSQFFNNYWDKYFSNYAEAKDYKLLMKKMQ
jgi:uncharacterized FlgJ-related protein